MAPRRFYVKTNQMKSFHLTIHLRHLHTTVYTMANDDELDISDTAASTYPDFILEEPTHRVENSLDSDLYSDQEPDSKHQSPICKSC